MCSIINMLHLLLYLKVWAVYSYADNWLGICATGQKQSPVNIVRYQDEDLKLIPNVQEVIELDDDFAYIYLNVGESESKAFVQDSVISIVGSYGDITFQPSEGEYETYTVTGLTIHTPSEHRIDNENYHLEVQIFLKNAQNQVLALAILHDDDGVDHDFLTNVEDCYENGDDLDLDLEFPNTRKIGRYFKYSGSLTSQPCTENVTWIVWKTIQGASSSQIQYFKKLTGNNSRPVQELNSREIVYYQGSDDFSSSSALTYLIPFIIISLF